MNTAIVLFAVIAAASAGVLAPAPLLAGPAPLAYGAYGPAIAHPAIAHPVAYAGLGAPLLAKAALPAPVLAAHAPLAYGAYGHPLAAPAIIG